MPLVFDDLHRMASRYLSKEAEGHLLQSTALVNEVLLKLLKCKSLAWENRKHFYGFVANQMRNTLVDCARERDRKKRGSGARHSSLEEALSVAESRYLDLVALDDALNDLEEVDKDARLVVELRFFVGLTLQQIADISGVSLMTVRRRWGRARVWLYRELSVAGKLSEPQPASEVVAGEAPARQDDPVLGG